MTKKGRDIAELICRVSKNMMRILERLQKSDILDEKRTSIALLNKIYEKGL